MNFEHCGTDFLFLCGQLYFPPPTCGVVSHHYTLVKTSCAYRHLVMRTYSFVFSFYYHLKQYQRYCDKGVSYLVITLVAHNNIIFGFSSHFQESTWIFHCTSSGSALSHRHQRDRCPGTQPFPSSSCSEST